MGTVWGIGMGMGVGLDLGVSNYTCTGNRNGLVMDMGEVWIRICFVYECGYEYEYEYECGYGHGNECERTC